MIFHNPAELAQNLNIALGTLETHYQGIIHIILQRVHAAWNYQISLASQ